MATTFRDPEPIPSKPDRVPAPNIMAKPVFSRGERCSAPLYRSLRTLRSIATGRREDQVRWNRCAAFGIGQLARRTAAEQYRKRFPGPRLVSGYLEKLQKAHPVSLRSRETCRCGYWSIHLEHRRPQNRMRLQ